MEEIKQGLEEPCFYVSCINPTTDLFLGKRYFRQNQFVIQYFPESQDYQAECNNVAERMTWCLEIVSADGVRIRGTKMKHETIGGVLHFFVNYDCFVYRIEEVTAMGSLDDIQINVKG
jgi:hypothetical protein